MSPGASPGVHGAALPIVVGMARPGCPRTRCAASRTGLSLVEVLCGLAVSSVLVGGIGSALVLSGQAIPSRTSSAPLHVVSSARTVDGVAAELRYAIDVIELGVHAVTFRVHDRDGDGEPETIRYAWSGTPGDPLTRAVNLSDAESIVPEVDDLAFTYQRRTETATTETSVTTTSPEALLASFTGWTGITPVQSQLQVTATTWLVELASLNIASMPADAKNLTITQVRMKLKKPSSGGADVTVGVHLPDAAGSNVPQSTPVGTPATVPLAAMTTSFAWVSASPIGAVFATPVTEIIIVLKGTSTGGSGFGQYANTTSAPADANVMRWTTTSGSSWLPSGSQQANDAYFEVYGTYEVLQTQSVSSQKHHLVEVGVELAATESAPRVRTTAHILNEPRVPAP
ncbi:MAG: hypothetical protein ACKVU4_12125 [Phycisphaerales bacterium]